MFEEWTDYMFALQCQWVGYMFSSIMYMTYPPHKHFPGSQIIFLNGICRRLDDCKLLLISTKLHPTENINVWQRLMLKQYCIPSRRRHGKHMEQWQWRSRLCDIPFRCEPRCRIGRESLHWRRWFWMQAIFELFRDRNWGRLSWVNVRLQSSQMHYICWEGIRTKLLALPDDYRAQKRSTDSL